MLITQARERWSREIAALNPWSWRFFAVTTALAWAPSMVIGALVFTVFPGQSHPSGFSRNEFLVLGLVGAPILETLLMWAALLSLRQHKLSDKYACGIIAFVAILLHSPARTWGLPQGWGFWIMAHAFRFAETRIGIRRTLVLAAAIHAAANALSFSSLTVGMLLWGE